MPESDRHPAPAEASATPYADLNSVLGDLLEQARATLATNFCGAYLQGSFALGDADIHSDVDFLVVTHDEVSATQEVGLRLSHARFPDLEVGWAQHLEGSYVPRAALRQVDPTGTPWLYVDNGSRIMERSDHDNSAVVRWVLRNHGVVLAGPDPKVLVEPVTEEVLGNEVRATMHEWAVVLRSAAAAMNNAWRQPYVVLSYCRMLHTLASGRVTSKLEAGNWAVSSLDPRWSALIQAALDSRPDPWLRVHQPGDPQAVEATWRFLDYAVALAP
jgi:hypothetical protein